MTLDELGPGQSGTVVGIGGAGVFRRRLLELGFVPGTSVLRCEGSPGGDPLAYLVRGAVLALRRSDARHIQVEGS